jgi:Type VI secretion system/phage-baseplate injector OB domain
MSMDCGEDNQLPGRSAITRYHGKYAGIVTDNGAPPSGTHRGQVTANVPGILEETADGTSNQPLKVFAAPGLPPGFFFVPEVDDTIWVEFVNGDINYPIWTGVWYAADAAPQTVDGQAPTQDQKIIRTKAGFVIQIDDTSGSEKLVVKDKTNSTTITLDSNGAAITADNGVTITCGQCSLSLSSSQIQLKSSGATLTISSTVAVS